MKFRCCDKYYAYKNMVFGPTMTKAEFNADKRIAKTLFEERCYGNGDLPISNFASSTYNVVVK